MKTGREQGAEVVLCCLVHVPPSFRATALQKCAVVPRRARVSGAQTFVSVNSRLESEKTTRRVPFSLCFSPPPLCRHMTAFEPVDCLKANKRARSTSCDTVAWLHPLSAVLILGGYHVIRKEAELSYRTSSSVRLWWEFEEPEGPKYFSSWSGSVGAGSIY